MCVKLLNFEGNMMKLITILFAGLLMMTVSACSTMEGMGKDLQSLGKTMETSAKPSTKIDPMQPVEQPSGAVVTPIK
jgi:predicted small secreted protein